MKRYMSGNLVKYKGQVHKVHTSTGGYVTLDDVFINLEDGEI